MDPVSGTSRLSSKHQVTIPQRICKQLGLREGDQVEFVIEKGQAFLRPVRHPRNSFSRWVGAFPMEQSSQDWVREMRDDIPGAMDY